MLITLTSVCICNSMRTIEIQPRSEGIKNSGRNSRVVSRKSQVIPTVRRDKVSTRIKKKKIMMYTQECVYRHAIVVPKETCSPCKLDYISAKDALTLSSPESGCCQINVLEALSHVVT